jgi:hypothetical protein
MSSLSIWTAPGWAGWALGRVNGQAVNSTVMLIITMAM